MNSKMYTVAELGKLIESGKSYLIAGDEEQLKQLPKGNWVAGTIPYFMADAGGLVSKEQIFATEIPAFVTKTTIKVYDEKNIENVYEEAPDNGFSLIIIPAMSPMHSTFALNAPNYKSFASRPLVGWISGVHLSDLGKITPKVINGSTGELAENKAVVMQLELSSEYVCDVGIVNIFNQGSGDTLEFLENGFSAKEALVNGKRTNFADYMKEKNINVKLPLVANYHGAMINASFQSVDEAKKEVTFYAPVFQGVQYKQAGPIKDYVAEFVSNMPSEGTEILFSCNCILNFLFSELEGKKTAGITGPITFGEVAYQLLNQTLVYLNIIKV